VVSPLLTAVKVEPTGAVTPLGFVGADVGEALRRGLGELGGAFGADVFLLREGGGWHMQVVRGRREIGGGEGGGGEDLGEEELEEVGEVEVIVRGRMDRWDWKKELREEVLGERDE
jgi:hypothetical protein